VHSLLPVFLDYAGAERIDVGLRRHCRSDGADCQNISGALSDFSAAAVAMLLVWCSFNQTLVPLASSVETVFTPFSTASASSGARAMLADLPLKSRRLFGLRQSWIGGHF